MIYFEHAFGQTHVIVQVRKCHLRFNHPELCCAWRAVLEFSARKVGPKVYTLRNAIA